MSYNYLISVAQFAAKAHQGQQRKYSGLPYIGHPLRVAGTVMLRPDATEEYVAAAWAHDVLEDCPTITLPKLAEAIGAPAAFLVQNLTHPPLSAGNRATRQALYRKQLIDAPYYAKVIKLIDRLDNLREMPDMKTVQPDEVKFLKLYAKESLELIEAIGKVDPPLAFDIETTAKRWL